MFSHCDPHTTDTGKLKAVHFKSDDGCSPHRSLTYDARGIFTPSEMLFPGLLPWVKQRDLVLGHGIKRRLTIRLETIARWTGEAEVAGNCVAVRANGERYAQSQTSRT